jgi:transposase
VERLIERCAGLDVHKASVTATVRVPGEQGGRRTETRTFRATTAGLVLLGDWLASFGVTVVGMESTGVYWKPVYYLLEDDFEVWLLNAQHLKNVPGRKTDVADSVWICQLVEHGLVRPSFVPPKPIRELAGSDPLPQGGVGRAHPGGPAAAQGAGGCRDQAGQRGQ